MKILYVTLFDDLFPSARSRVYLVKDSLPESMKAKVICIYKLNVNELNILHRYTYLFFIVLKKVFVLLRVLFVAKKYDRIVFHLMPISYLPAKILLSLNKNIIYDFVDNLNFKKKYFFFYRNVKLITTNSKYLLEKSKLYNPNSKLLFDPFKKSSYKIERRGVLTIGWTGSSSTTNYLDSIIDICDKVKKKYGKKVNFLFIGADTKILNKINATVIPYTNKTENEDIRKIDIGLTPLDSSSRSLAKNTYKIYQYMANGIPQVATNIGMNKLSINHNENGFLVDTKDEWYSSICRLVDNEKLRMSIGKRAITDFNNNFTNKVIDDFIETYK